MFNPPHHKRKRGPIDGTRFVTPDSSHFDLPCLLNSAPTNMTETTTRLEGLPGTGTIGLKTGCEKPVGLRAHVTGTAQLRPFEKANKPINRNHWGTKARLFTHSSIVSVCPITLLRFKNWTVGIVPQRKVRSETGDGYKQIFHRLWRKKEEDMNWSLTGVSYEEDGYPLTYDAAHIPVYHDRKQPAGPFSRSTCKRTHRERKEPERE